MAELVDALDLGSSGVTLESSSLSFRTKLSRPTCYGGAGMYAAAEPASACRRVFRGEEEAEATNAISTAINSLQ